MGLGYGEVVIVVTHMNSQRGHRVVVIFMQGAVFVMHVVQSVIVDWPRENVVSARWPTGDRAMAKV